MDIALTTLLLCTLAYFAAGFVDAIAGGGGLITLPTLMLAGLPPHQVLGTNKLAMACGSLCALFSYLRSGMVVLAALPAGFASAFAGGMLGSHLALVLPSSLLGKILVIMLPIGMVASLFMGRPCAGQGALPSRGLALRVAAIGLAIGCYDGFFGPGTGSFLIIALHLFLHLGFVRSSATAKVMNLASNVGACVMLAGGGVVVYGLALPCAVASIAGNLLGVRFSLAVGEKAVRGFLYVALSLLFATLVYRFFLA